MSDEFKEAYENLSLQEKRNQISNELLFISEFIKNIEDEYNISSSLNLEKYDLDISKDENEVLKCLYEGVYKIEKELITLFSTIFKQ